MFFKDLSVVNKNTPVKNEFINSFTDEGLIVFFGYVGCNTVCTPRLSELSLVLNNIADETRNKFQFIFINLKYSKYDDQADLFVKSFNDGFKGYTLSEEKTKKLAREFGSYYSVSLLDKNEINHSNNLYFLKKNKKKFILKAIYTNPKVDRYDLEKILKRI
jgi:protein SCO1/2